MSKNVKKICNNKQIDNKPKYHRKEEKKPKEEELKPVVEDNLKEKINEEERKTIEERRLQAQEELLRLNREEEALTQWKNAHENQMTKAYDKIIEAEDWYNYSNCIPNYIDIRKEKQIRGFLYDFKSSCDDNFILNFRLVERNIDEDILIFNSSQLHYHNLERLLYQAKALIQPYYLNYSLELMNSIREAEIMKIESITKYFIDNYHQFKNAKLLESRRKEDKPELCWEYSNNSGNIQLVFWANNLVHNNAYRSVSTKFRNMPISIYELNKHFVTRYSIIRVLWYNNDIREYLYNKKGIEAYTPYMSISGSFIIDELVYPSNPQLKGTWEIREFIGNKYKPLDGPEGGFTKNVKMRYKLDIKPKINLKDIDNVNVGLYDQSTGKWILQQDITYKKHERSVILNTSELGIYSILLERKINFPYLNWYLRCIIQNEQLVALLDITSPRGNFSFEIGISDPDSGETIKRKDPVHAYVKLINNTEPEFEHIANKELTYNQMILEFKECGILLASWTEDIIEAGLKEKDYMTTDRAIEDLVLNCRYYAFRSHEYNQLLSPDVIAVKAKPNPNYDSKFFDDEEKDWADFAWYPNKATIGKFTIENDESVVFKQTIDITRPYLHLIIKDTMPEDVYCQVSEDDFSSAFLVNLRNFIRLLGIVHMP